MLAGCVILGFGMSIIIKSNSGTGPNDLIAMIFSDKINQHRRIAFRWVRIGCDVFFVAVGFFLGGTVGIGTVVAALLTGPVVQFFLPLSEKTVSYTHLDSADGKNFFGSGGMRDGEDFVMPGEYYLVLTNNGAAPDSGNTNLCLFPLFTHGVPLKDVLGLIIQSFRYGIGQHQGGAGRRDVYKRQERL